MPKLTKRSGSGFDWEEIKFIAQNARELEKRDFLRTYETVEEGILYGISVSGAVELALIDDEPCAIYGIGKDDLTPEVGYPWLVLTEQATKHPFLVMKEAKTWFKYKQSAKKRLTNLVPCEDDAAVRFLEVLGFTVEFDHIVERDGGDYYVFWFERGIA